MQKQFATQFTFGTKWLLSMPGTVKPVSVKGRPTSMPSLAPSVRHLSFSVATDKYIIMWICILLGYVPVSQWVPSYPASQVQAYWFTWSTHVAPFIQGSLAHSSVSGKLDLNIHCFSLELNAIVLLGCNLYNSIRTIRDYIYGIWQLTVLSMKM